MVIVSFAVAFLMMMLSTSYVDRQVAWDVRARTAGRRLLAEWVDKLTVPMTGPALATKLAGTSVGSSLWKELRGWGQLSEEEMASLHSLAQRRAVYDRFLARLKPGERSALIGTREGDEVYLFLADDRAREEFLNRVKSVRSASFPTTPEELTAFVRDFRKSMAVRKRILAGHATAVAGLQKELRGTAVLDLFSGKDLKRTQAVLNRHGFHPSLEELHTLRTEAVGALDAQLLAGLLRYGRMRSVIAKRTGAEVSQVTPRHLFRIASSRAGARWLKEQVDITRQKQQQQLINDLQEHLERLEKPEGEVKEPPEVLEGRKERLRRRLRRLQEHPEEVPELVQPLRLSEKRIAEVASTQLERQRLSEIEAGLSAESGDGWLGFSKRTTWLIIISFVVCVVGVANAMLMSVTERFREIATMKCLGAMDSFIMISFVLESSLQGLAGGIVGVVLGLLLGVTRSLWSFGWLTLVNLPGTLLLVSGGVCLLAGVVLAAAAAVYPAFVAARLAPMEAMRIE